MTYVDMAKYVQLKSQFVNSASQVFASQPIPSVKNAKRRGMGN